MPVRQPIARTHRSRRGRCATALLTLALALAACGPAEDTARPATVGDALDAGDPIVLAEGTDLTTPAGKRHELGVRALAASLASLGPAQAITVDYPLEGSVFPPGFVPPTFLWHDATPGVDAWLVSARAADGEPLWILTAGGAPEIGWVDRRVISETNELYVPTDHQASAQSWKPTPAVWAEIQSRSTETAVTIEFAGFARADTTRALSRGAVRITTSRDEVGAPIFYRDVPLMPSVAKEGGELKIKPLPEPAMPLIEWRLRDVTLPESKLVLTGMSKCGNCHSFSRDGKTLGMDVDGPTGDKGAYAMVDLAPQTVIRSDDVITWNSYPDRGESQKTIGFLSRISPDGRIALSTVNEALYVSNFANYRFLQVFFPTRGILAWTASETGEIRALPGADDPDFVHCNPVWSPDGTWIVFSRAKAFDPPKLFSMMARYPNDEREPKIQYDLYRMPFDEGRGGTPVPVEGASQNGMSNTFPKISPDGKWIVYTKCKNGLLMRPDGRLWIVPTEGGEAREMRCNTPLMNSWHSFSPNGRWMVFSSKWNTPYTQMFLTHIDADGNDTPPILIPDSTASNRAVNIPEFLNAPFDSLDDISVPTVGHRAADAYFAQGNELLDEGHFAHAARLLEKAVGLRPDFVRARVNLAFSLERSGALERAAEAYHRVLDIDPADPLSNGALGALETAPPLAGESVVDLRAAAKEKPDSLPEGRRLGLALARIEVSDEAALILEAVLRVTPDDAEVRRELATLYLRRTNARSALPHLEAVAALAPDDLRSRLTLSWLASTAEDPALRDPRRAVEHARLACQQTKFENASALDAYAAALAADGNLREAIQRAERAAQLAAADDPSLAEWIGRRLEVYREGRPLRR